MPREKDSLTQLYTASYIEDDLEDEMSRARRFGRDLGLLLMEPVIPESLRLDMNYPVLKRLAQVCRACTRQVDSGVRLGNQVLLVLPETSADGIQTIATKIGEQFGECSFTHSNTGNTFQGEFREAQTVFPNEVQTARDLVEALKSQLKEEIHFEAEDE